jgi:putative ABC transport system permease protein
VNVANLLLARSAGRAREIAIRASVGATRWRIVRQLIVENLMLAFAAGGLGLWLSRFGVHFIADAFGRNVPYWMRFTVDGHVLAILVGLCVVTSLVFGLAPALFVSKTNVAAVIKETGRSGSPRARRWTNILLVAELAVALTLLAGAALIVRSFLAIYRTDTIVDASRVLTVSVTLPENRYATPEQRAGFYQQLDERLAAIPGIPFATVASSRPFVAAQSRTLSFGDRPAGATGDLQPSVAVVWIGSRYFESLGVQVQRGRGFTAVDGMPGHEAAIVNQRFADRYFANTNPLGQRIRLSQDKADPRPPQWLTIVGVSPTIRQAVASGARPAVYLPLRTHAGAGAALLAGRVAEPATLAPLLRRTVASLDDSITLHNVRLLSELRADSRLQPRLIGTVLSAFAVIALLLSMVGLYAMTAYAVLQRTREIGVRMALGAQPQQVVWLFVRRALLPLGIGLSLGLVGAFVASQLLRGLLRQTGVTDATTIGLMVLLFVGVALAACVLPSRRAARLDPLSVLRYE